MTTRKRPTTLPIGTISEGTLRPEDLIPAYLYELERLRLTKAERAIVRQVQHNTNTELTECGGCGAYHFKDYHGDCRNDDARFPTDEYFDSESASFDIDELTTILENHVPDYCYFGTLEGDGACFGVWPSIDSLEEECRNGQVYKDNHFKVVKINAGDSFPSTAHAEYVMSVTDHGNVTLYRRSGKRWIEVWSVV